MADKKKSNGKSENDLATVAGPAVTAAQDTSPNPQLDPEIVKKIAQVRSHVRESFGKVVMAMMMLPRYRHQSLEDLQGILSTQC